MRFGDRDQDPRHKNSRLNAAARLLAFQLNECGLLKLLTGALHYKFLSKSRCLSWAI